VKFFLQAGFVSDLQTLLWWQDLNNINGSKLRVWEISEALKSLEHGKDPGSFLSNSQIIKVMQKIYTIIFDFSEKHMQMSIILNFASFPL
jgi:hypothetical protein